MWSRSVAGSKFKFQPGGMTQTPTAEWGVYTYSNSVSGSLMLDFLSPTVEQNLDITVYHPQLNLGSTLWPYSPPSGAPSTIQTATDYSGNGNHLTLGADTNASTDDPAFTGTAWSFDGGDYLLGPTTAMWSNTAGMSVVAVWGVPSNATAAAMCNQYASATNKRQWFFCGNDAWNLSVQQNPASADSNMTASLSSSPTAGQTHFLAGRWLPSVRTQIISGNFAAQAVATTPAASMTDCSVALEIGRYNQGVSFAPAGSACHLLAIYNRYLVDSEISRAYVYLKSLMARRGVTLA